MAERSLPVLDYIEVENFKSYKGRTIIGPLKTFNAVIGPNGSGKSNFMDAISFVMGEKTQELRVKRLGDLIHGASVGQPISKSASVSAIFKMDYVGTSKRFTRCVQGSSSEYRIDDEVVSVQTYLETLESMKINVKAKNFLVFQGAIENIAMKSPEERTILFEEISGSGTLKDEYEKCKIKVQVAEEATNMLYIKKRGVVAECKEAKLEQEEANKYHNLRKELERKEIEYQLFRLYHNKADTEAIESEISSKNEDVKNAETKKKKAEEELKNIKKKTRICNQSISKNRFGYSSSFEINKKRPAFIKSKERIAHNQKKLDSDKKQLSSVRKAVEEYKKDIKDLQQELNEVKKQKREFKNTAKQESLSKGHNVTLEDEQVNEYKKLKIAAQKQSALCLQDLDSINREQKSDQDKLDNEIRVRTDLETKIKQKRHEIEKEERRVEKLSKYIEASNKSLDEQKSLKNNLTEVIKNSKENVCKLQKTLEEVTEQLGDAKVNKYDDNRRKKKEELIEKLKEAYPGVYDRLINLCHPINQRYNVAITKVLGKYVEAIVVDTEATARLCIQYLKDHLLDPETFLPIDYLQTKPLKERLRSITKVKNVKLLYDVLEFNDQIKRVFLFATNNTLVCDSPEDAMKVAYELDGGDGRQNTVALDGTFYQKSGIISGGSLDLALKAKRWDQKDMAKLKASKEKLTDQLREEMKQLRKESEKNTIESQIHGLEMRLRKATEDRDNGQKLIAQFRADLEKQEPQLISNRPLMEEIEQRMCKRDKDIQKKKESMNRVEDDIFADFCHRLGLPDIRQYEERELRSQEERAKRKLEFKNQKTRIKTQIQYETAKLKEMDLDRWKRAVDEDERELENAKSSETEQMNAIEADMANVEELKVEKVAQKKKVDSLSEEISKVGEEVARATKELQLTQKAVYTLEVKYEAKMSERYGILKQCKMEGVQIPIREGNLDDVALDFTTTKQDMSDKSAARSSSSTNHSTIGDSSIAKIVVEYDDEENPLSPDLKDIGKADDVRKKDSEMSKEINDLRVTLQKIQAPNMKAEEKFQNAKTLVCKTDAEFNEQRMVAKKAKQEFELVKKQRHDKFMTCFEHVSNEIDNIYKSAQAFLGPENPEEPYLEGINYNCVAPGKRFQTMSNLSGGEKTIAALTLLFAIHSYQPAPFFVLDEIDASLDNTNIGKLASYIREKELQLQTIVISLKEEFYSHADALIGICPDEGESLVSRVLTINLTEFED